MDGLEKLSHAIEKKELQQNELRKKEADDFHEKEKKILKRSTAFIQESDKLIEHLISLLKKFENNIISETDYYSVGCGELSRNRYNVRGMRISAYNKYISIIPQDLDKGYWLGTAILNVDCLKDRDFQIETSLILRENNEEKYDWFIHEHSNTVENKNNKKLNDENFYEFLLDKLDL